MKTQTFIIPSGTWTGVKGTGMEIWHASGRNLLASRCADGSLRLDSSGVVWLVRPVTNGQAPTIVET